MNHQVAETAAEPVDGAESPPPLDVRRLALQVIGVGVGFMMLIVGLGAAFWDPLHALSETFVTHLGGPGIFLGFFIPDGFSVPMPVDAFTTFGLLGGIPFWEVVAWAASGSLLGGIVGYHVGGWLRRFQWFKRFYGKRAEEMDALVASYGAVALAATALTPLPYSLGCWAAGALKMPMPQFLLVSLLRIPRVAGYLALIHFGLITITL
jgi:membrane protein YqaA with SNARE-associated domain